VRVAVWNSAFSRDGPGILLRDILDAKSDDIERGIAMIDRVDPDILLLANFDYDFGLAAARAISARLASEYPYILALRPNSGMPSGRDLDGDGRLGGPGDAHGYGAFSGQGGMALFSRFPPGVDRVVDLSAMLWVDLPGNLMTAEERQGAAAELRLSSVGHWIVPVEIAPDKDLRLLVWHAGTPAFDGPTARNARRNHDENALWSGLLDSELSHESPEGAFVLLGAANLDPRDGLGRRQAIRALLSDPRLQDPRPASRGAGAASREQAGPNPNHQGDPSLDTADFRDSGGPGNLRVEYVLPSRALEVVDAGVFWPAPDEPDHAIMSGRDPKISWHGIVWVDVAR